jgi:hypothetical protein
VRVAKGQHVENGAVLLVLEPVGETNGTAADE